MINKSSNEPSLAIVIINWNDFDQTAACLKSLKQLHYSNFEVIVVDNDSSDDSLERLQESFSWPFYVQNEENLGFTGGNNAGIDFAMQKDYELLLLLNNDTIVEPNFLGILVDTLVSNEEIGAVQPKILYNKERSRIWNAGGKFNPFFSLARTIGEGEIDKGQYDETRETEWITGCALLIRSEVIAKVGKESDIFFYGCYDDLEWSIRIKEGGYKLMYCPEAIIYHDVMSAALEVEGKKKSIKPFFHYLVNRNHWFFIRLHTKGLYRVTSYAYQLIKFLGYFAYFLVKGRFFKLKAFVHGFFNGIVQPMDPKRLNHLSYIQKYK